MFIDKTRCKVTEIYCFTSILSVDLTAFCFQTINFVYLMLH